MANPVLKKFEISKNVTVSWEWKDEKEGLITWEFKNNSPQPESVVLYRNGYYFGNAFWCVYENNPEFNTKFVTKPEALITGQQAPLFVAEMHNKYIVALLFTIKGNGTYEMTEGGFVDGMKPEDYKVYTVTDGQVEKMSIGYDTSQVTQWDEQSNTDYKGYSPNPKEFEVYVGKVDAPFVELYNDTIKPVETEKPAPVKNCHEYEDDVMVALHNFDFIQAIEAMVDYLRCIENESN